MRRGFAPILLAILVVGVVVVSDAGWGKTARAGATYDHLVDPDLIQCATGSTVHQTVADAVEAAQPGDTIFVCAGTYYEVTLIFDDAGVSLLGPGSTPADDGIATIMLDADVSIGALVLANGVTISGLSFDASPNGSPNTIAIFAPGGDTAADSATVSDNIITGATSGAVRVSNSLGSGPYVITGNTIDSADRAIECTCSNAQIAGNTVAAGIIEATGSNNVISENEIDGNGSERTALNAGNGTGITITQNQLSNGGDQTTILGIFAYSGVTTEATVTKNTFDSAPVAIGLVEDEPGTLSATIGGGSMSDANVFTDSGEGFGGLVTLFGVANDINAQNNSWGFCTAEEIAFRIFDHADSPSLGSVHFEPFIAPASCPSVTPSPSATPTPTPTSTPAASATPTPTGGSQQVAWGDHNCSGSADPIDGLLNLRHDAGLSTDTATCPEMGDEINVQGDGTHPWGDLDCSGAADPIDGLKVLRFDAGLDVARPDDCPDPGEIVTVN